MIPNSKKTKTLIDLINPDDEKQFKKDCSGYGYINLYIPAVPRVIVIGDIHSDYDLMIKSLRVADIINKNNEWIAKPSNTIVVQVGDQIDGCRPYMYKCSDPRATYKDEASDMKILKFFTELDTKAREVGGRVISLIGNHEIMNAQGNFTYVSHKELTSTGEEARKEAFKPGGEVASFLACTRLSCVVIGSSLFVHAGILPELMKKFNITGLPDLQKLNTLIRKWLLGQITSDISNIINSNKLSPFWTRIFGYITPQTNSATCDIYLDPVIKALKVGHIIIGHTPQYYTHKQGINSSCDDKLWKVDLGLSKAFHPFDEFSHIKKEVQVLEILDDKKFNIIK